MKVDWYGYLNEPVLQKCRFIESLCKADGWSSGPPIVTLDWGGVSKELELTQLGRPITDRMFHDHEFIVVKASYTLRTFTKNKQSTFLGNPTILYNYNTWPVHALQTIVMKRISNKQLTHKEIRKF